MYKGEAAVAWFNRLSLTQIGPDWRSAVTCSWQGGIRLLGREKCQPRFFGIDKVDVTISPLQLQRLPLCCLLACAASLGEQTV